MRLYPKWAERLFTEMGAPAVDSQWRASGQTFRLMGLGAGFTFNATDVYLSDIAVDRRVTAGIAITGRTYDAAGVTALAGFNWADEGLLFANTLRLASATGAIYSWLIYHDTGTESTSRLLAHLPVEAGGVSGLPLALLAGEKWLIRPGTDAPLVLKSAASLAAGLGFLMGHFVAPYLDKTQMRLYCWEADGTSFPMTDVSGDRGTYYFASVTGQTFTDGRILIDDCSVTCGTDPIQLWSLNVLENGGSASDIQDWKTIFISAVGMPVTPPLDGVLTFDFGTTGIRLGAP